MPVEAKPQPWPEPEMGKPTAGEPREMTVTVGKPRTITVEAGR